MDAKSLLLYVGIALMAISAGRLSTSLGLSDFLDRSLYLFAGGIILVARESSRQLSNRVRLLEAMLAERAESLDGTRRTPAA